MVRRRSRRDAPDISSTLMAENTGPDVEVAVEHVGVDHVEEPEPEPDDDGVRTLQRLE